MLNPQKGPEKDENMYARSKDGAPELREINENPVSVARLQLLGRSVWYNNACFKLSLERGGKRCV
jgi:hypothetical protein